MAASVNFPAEPFLRRPSARAQRSPPGPVLGARAIPARSSIAATGIRETTTTLPSQALLARAALPIFLSASVYASRSSTADTHLQPRGSGFREQDRWRPLARLDRFGLHHSTPRTLGSCFRRGIGRHRGKGGTQDTAGVRNPWLAIPPAQGTGGAGNAKGGAVLCEKCGGGRNRRAAPHRPRHPPPVVGCRRAAAVGGCAGRERRSLAVCGVLVKNGNRRLVRSTVEGIVRRGLVSGGCPVRGVSAG